MLRIGRHRHLWRELGRGGDREATSGLQRVVCLGLLALLLAGCRQVEQTIAFTPLFSTPSQTPQSVDQALHILFVGNSYTDSYHSLPQMFANMAQSSGQQVEVAVLAPGGWTLAQHVEDRRTLDKIDERKWDFVVLQENGRIASVASKCREQTYPAAHTLSERIGAGESRIILFMQWGCRDGTPDCDNRDFDEMQAQLHSCYTDLANELGAMVAPVGNAWQNAVAQNPQLDLWYRDGLHSSETGTYLAACVFYAVVYQQGPEGLTYTAGLAGETAEFLQHIAAETALENSE